MYIGTVFADVNTASRTDPRGVLASQGQDVDLYVPGGHPSVWPSLLLADRRSQRGPGHRDLQGQGVELHGRAGSLSASLRIGQSRRSGSAGEAEGPSKTIDKSGLDNADLHSSRKADMWLSSNVPAGGSAWIRYEFDDVYLVHQMQVWNHNSELESVIGLGIKEAMVESSIDVNVSGDTLGINTRDGQWHHAAGVCQAGTIHLYLDGRLLGRATDPASGFELQGDALFIGRDTRTGSTVFKGDLWRRALSQDEIVSLVSGGSVSKEGLVAQYACPAKADCSTQAASAETSGSPEGPFHAEAAPGACLQVISDSPKACFD